MICHRELVVRSTMAAATFNPGLEQFFPPEKIVSSEENYGNNCNKSHIALEPTKKPTIDPQSKKDQLNGPKRFFSSTDFFHEFLRLMTFLNFVSNDVDIKELAKNGFVAIHNGDLAQCVYCNGIIGLWEKTDNIKFEHEKHYPDCPSITGTMANVPDDDSDIDKSLKYKLNHTMPKRESKFSAGKKSTFLSSPTHQVLNLLRHFD